MTRLATKSHGRARGAFLSLSRRFATRLEATFSTTKAKPPSADGGGADGGGGDDAAKAVKAAKAAEAAKKKKKELVQARGRLVAESVPFFFSSLSARVGSSGVYLSRVWRGSRPPGRAVWCIFVRVRFVVAAVAVGGVSRTLVAGA